MIGNLNNNSNNTNNNKMKNMLFRAFLIFLVIFASSAIMIAINNNTNVSSSSKKYYQHDFSSLKVFDTIKSTKQTCHNKSGQLYYIKSPSAKCLDGSDPAYYFRKGMESGFNKWILHFEGGGWCFDYEQCELRSNTPLGSSNEYSPCLQDNGLKYYMSGLRTNNPMMYNWNTVLVKYCDGSSYAGDTEMKHKGKTLYFRGKNNRDETIQSLLELGMSEASEVVISGCSAGGLGIFLGIDQMAEIIHKTNKKTIVRGLADSGLFLDHTSDYVTPLTHLPHGRDEASVNGLLDYSSSMKRLFLFTNSSSGVNPSCIKHYSMSSSLSAKNNNNNNNNNNNEISAYPMITNCIFAENIFPFIETPIFALQPQYDQWNILHIIGKNFNTSSVNSYGKKVVSIIISKLIYSSKNIFNGCFIDSCAHHCTGCSDTREDSWNGKNIVSIGIDKKNITAAHAFEKWYKFLNKSSEHLSSIKKLTKIDITWKYFHQDYPFPCSNCCLCTVYK